MRIHDAFLPTLLALALVAPGPAAAQRVASAQHIDSLLARMTLEEKLGQLNLPSVDGRPNAAQLALLRRGLVGGFLNLTGAAAARETQEVAVKESRLGIPLLLGYDVIHGYRTTFPIPLAEASTWDPAVVEAFRKHGVFLDCGDNDGTDDWCELERGHAGDHGDDSGKRWPRNAVPLDG